MKPLGTWLFRIVGGAAVLAGSFFGTLWLMDSFGGPSMLDVVRSGAQVQVTFDPKVCATLSIGELVCDTPYVGRYEQAANRWTLSGKNKNIAGTSTNPATNAPNEPGNISIWGVLGTFDRAGTLRMQGKDAGTIRPSQSQK
jgi:hypothetical protein